MSIFRLDLDVVVQLKLIRLLGRMQHSKRIGQRREALHNHETWVVISAMQTHLVPVQVSEPAGVCRQEVVLGQLDGRLGGVGGVHQGHRDAGHELLVELDRVGVVEAVVDIEVVMLLALVMALVLLLVLEAVGGHRVEGRWWGVGRRHQWRGSWDAKDGI